MIHTHESNSAWWGQPVGIITDAAWFDLDVATREKSLSSYAWVEFKADINAAPPERKINQAGFMCSDVQMNFRIGLNHLSETPSLDAYQCHSAADEAFVIKEGDIRSFEHERYLQIPGVTHEMLNRRYVTWANEILKRSPETCVRLMYEGQTQGWFLSEPEGSSIGLVLAMLSENAAVSGQHLYHRALLHYAQIGFIMGKAAFSVRNTSVLNIYSQLGARFTSPTGCWLRVRTST